MGFKTVTIVGVGLIGGSIGLALKERRLAKRVIGVGYRRKTLSQALAGDAIDEATLSVPTGVREADLVVVATPVSLIPEKVSEAVRHAPDNCVFTDVGSTKRMISRDLRSVKRFVPSHPIAGSELRGNQAAQADLFEGALCVLTPGRGADGKVLSAVRRFWKSLGMRTVEMTPAAHDALLSVTSHLPHVAAAALVLLTGPTRSRFAGSGFRDTTRIAAGDPRVWEDVLLSNRDKVADALRSYRHKCGELERILREGDLKKLVSFLTRASRLRNRVSNNTG